MFKSLLLKNFETQDSICKVKVYDDGRVSINKFIFTIDEIHVFLNELNRWENCLLFNQNLRNVLNKNNIIKSVFVFSDLIQENNMPQYTDVYCIKSENFDAFFKLFSEMQNFPKRNAKSHATIRLEPLHHHDRTCLPITADLIES